MAISMSFYQGTGDFDEGWSLVVSLLSATNGFRLYEWIPKIARPDINGKWPVVQEVITLSCEGTDHDDIAAKMNVLDEMISRALFGRRTRNETYTYFYVKLDNETLPRAALVRNVQTEFSVSVNRPPLSPGNRVEGFRIVIQRHGAWEQSGSAGHSGDTYTNINTVGGVQDLSGILATSESPNARRIARTAFSAYALADGPIAELWMGFRSDWLGDSSEFGPFWAAEDASTFDADTTGGTAHADANAKSGYVAICTFSADTSLAERLILAMEDTLSASQLPHQNGRYLILGRFQCSGTRTYYVRLSANYSGASVWGVKDRIEVDSNGAYTMIPLGYVTVPGEAFTEAAGYLGGDREYEKYALRLEAGVKDAGTGNLEIDGFGFVPQDEGACYLKGAEIDDVDIVGEVDDLGTAYLFVEPDDRTTALSIPPDGVAGSGSVKKRLEHDAPRYSLPPRDSYLVLFAQRASRVSVLADDMDVYLAHAARYNTLRGDGAY